MANDNTVRITLTADGSDANEAFRQLNRQMGNTQREAGQTQRRFLDLENVVEQGVDTIRNAGIVIGTAATGLAYMTKQSLAATAQLEKNARMAGLNVEAYQELKHITSAYRIDTEAMADAFKELNLRADEWIQTGAGPAEEAFKRLGYEQDELNRKLKDAPALFEDLIARMEGLDKAAQIRIADEVFGGQGGEQFVTMLNAGSNAIGNLRDEAHELGLIMDEDLVQQAANANKQIDKLSKIVSAQFAVAVAEIAPELAHAAQNMLNWVAANQDFLEQNVPAAMVKVVDAAGFVFDAIEGVQRTFQVAGRSIAVVALGMEKELWGLANVIWNGPIDAVNFLIELYNKIPALPDIDYEIGQFQTGQYIEKQINVLERAIAEGKKDIESILLEPMPSDIFQDSFKNAQDNVQKTKAATKSVGEAGRQAGHTIADSADRAAQSYLDLYHDIGEVNKALEANAEKAQSTYTELYKSALKNNERFAEQYKKQAIAAHDVVLDSKEQEMRSILDSEQDYLAWRENEEQQFHEQLKSIAADFVNEETNLQNKRLKTAEQTLNERLRMEDEAARKANQLWERARPGGSSAGSSFGNTIEESMAGMGSGGFVMVTSNITGQTYGPFPNRRAADQYLDEKHAEIQRDQYSSRSKIQHSTSISRSTSSVSSAAVDVSNDSFVREIDSLVDNVESYLQKQEKKSWGPAEFWAEFTENQKAIDALSKRSDSYQEDTVNLYREQIDILKSVEQLNEDQLREQKRTVDNLRTNLASVQDVMLEISGIRPGSPSDFNIRSYNELLRDAMTTSQGETESEQAKAIQNFTQYARDFAGSIGNFAPGRQQEYLDAIMSDLGTLESNIGEGILDQFSGDNILNVLKEVQNAFDTDLPNSIQKALKTDSYSMETLYSAFKSTLPASVQDAVGEQGLDAFIASLTSTKSKAEDTTSPLGAAATNIKGVADTTAANLGIVLSNFDKLMTELKDISEAGGSGGDSSSGSSSSDFESGTSQGQLTSRSFTPGETVSEGFNFPVRYEGSYAETWNLPGGGARDVLVHESGAWKVKKTKDGWHDAIEYGNFNDGESISDKFDWYPSGRTFEFPNVEGSPVYQSAEGNIFQKPSVTEIAERNIPEAVVPFTEDKLRTFFQAAGVDMQQKNTAIIHFDPMIEEIKALRQELRSFKNEVSDADVQQIKWAQKTAKLLNRFDYEGLPPTRS